MTARQVNTCGRCDDRWTASRAAHCGGCHATFSSPSGFDAHRRGGACRDPRDAGLVARSGRSREARGAVWTAPGQDDEARRVGWLGGG